MQNTPFGVLCFGSATRDRTWDILLNREALYRLSYRGILENHSRMAPLIKKRQVQRNEAKKEVDCPSFSAVLALS
jgi:hypothetical protein